MRDFFGLDSVVYRILLQNMPDAAISTLSQLSSTTHRSVREHTQTTRYWLEKLENLGIENVPESFNPEPLYKGVYKTSRFLAERLTKLFDGSISEDQVRCLFNSSVIVNSPYVTKLLLESNTAGVDIGAHGNIAIIYASLRGDVELVRLLLQKDKRWEDIGAEQAIKSASSRGNVGVLKLLLQDRRVTHAKIESYAIEAASMNGHAEVVRILLTHICTGGNISRFLGLEARKGHTEVVRVLLEDGRANPAADYNYAIKAASFNGHTEVVRLLLEDGRANPTVEYNYAIEAAMINRHAEVVNLLMQDKRVRSTWKSR